MKLLIIFLTSSYAFAEAAKNDIIYFHIHGGAMQYYRSDKIIINANGSVILKTISPMFTDDPNMIGEFKANLNKRELLHIKTIISDAIKKIPTPHRQPSAKTVIEELHIKNQKTFWTSQESSKFIEIIRQEFLRLAKKAYKNPIKAMLLHCSQKRTRINCAYKNVGKEIVTTVDPLGVSYAISCLDIRGKITILHKIKEYHPKRMTPKKIKIGPRKEYKFSIKTGPTCSNRIIVRTTDMMINRKYNDALLGKLISNQLRR